MSATELAAGARTSYLAARHLVLILLVIVVWAFNFIVVRASVEEMPPILLTGLRFTLVAALLLPFARRPERMGPVIGVAISMGILHFICMFTAMGSGAPVAPLAIIAHLNVPISSALAAVFLGDRMGPWRMGGMALAIFGVAIMSFEPAVLTYASAMLLALAAALFWAMGNVQAKYYGITDVLGLNAYMALFSAPPLLILSLLIEPGSAASITEATWRGWLGVAYMGIMVTVFGYTVWFTLIQRYSVNVVTPWILLTPCVVALMGWWFLNEPLTWRIATGGLIALIGVGVVVIRRPQYADRAT
ncbi:DMT family transporter [Marinivivus vitaminiproducens]|uniref:DMT family transporter n=1 Tax=Marinivivus vitaminiproducens TaxID=3035935 RepID=UPI002799D896|nr:EamA family transporter [Geminicoccaceae bacterium SCSIO 64248]